MLSTPVSQRIEDYRAYQLPRVAEDLEHVLTDWHVDVDQ